VDANVVRIAFVLLTVFVGVGAVVYLAAWLLVPEEGSVSPAAAAGRRWLGPTASGEAADPDDRRRRSSSLVLGLVVVGVVIAVLAAGGPWWIGDGWHPGLGVGWILLAALAYLVLRPHRGRISLGRIVGVLAAAVVGLVVLVLSTTLVVEALTGVPLRGGVGSHDYRPSTAAQVQSSYRVAVGAMTLDLRQVSLPDRSTTVTASVGIGRLVVEVPPGVVVSLSAHSGVGDVVYRPSGQTAVVTPAGTSVGVSGRATAPQLILDADVGIGQVQLVRAAPDAPVDLGDGGSSMPTTTPSPTVPPTPAATPSPVAPPKPGRVPTAAASGGDGPARS
jgi:hypothetical protein